MTALRGLLGRRGFRRLLMGQTVSALGDWMATIALMVYVLALTDSTTAVGGVLVLRLLPAVVAGPVAARVSRRWGRRTVMLAMDATRAAVVVLLPLVTELWWVYLWAFVLEAAGLVFLPARDAAIPDLAGGRDLDVANGLMLGSSYGSIPVGAGLFALVGAAAGAAGAGEHLTFVAVFWLDALTYLVSFAAIKALAPGAVDGAAPERAVDETPGRFSDALRIPLVAAVVPAAATVALGVGALFSVGVSFVEEVLDASAGEFGALVALFGAGALLGLVGTRYLGEPGLPRVRAGVVAIGATVSLMSLSDSLGLALAGAVAFGAAASATLVVGMTVIQDRLRGAERELAFTAFHVTIRGGLALAAVLAGGVADLLGDVEWPGVGEVAPSRLVLLAAGVVTMLGAAAVREHQRRVVEAGVR